MEMILNVVWMPKSRLQSNTFFILDEYKINSADVSKTFAMKVECEVNVF